MHSEIQMPDEQYSSTVFLPPYKNNSRKLTLCAAGNAESVVDHRLSDLETFGEARNLGKRRTSVHAFFVAQTSSLPGKTLIQDEQRPI